jgi:hypothetical protein
MKMAVFWVVVSCSPVEVPEFIALMVEAARMSLKRKLLLNFYRTTRHCNPEDSLPRTHRREELVSCLINNEVSCLYDCLPRLGDDFARKTEAADFVEILQSIFRKTMALSSN